MDKTSSQTYLCSCLAQLLFKFFLVISKLVFIEKNECKCCEYINTSSWFLFCILKSLKHFQVFRICFLLWFLGAAGQYTKPVLVPETQIPCNPHSSWDTSEFSSIQACVPLQKNPSNHLQRKSWAPHILKDIQNFKRGFARITVQVEDERKMILCATSSCLQERSLSPWYGLSINLCFMNS